MNEQKNFADRYEYWLDEKMTRLENAVPLIISVPVIVIGIISELIVIFAFTISKLFRFPNKET